MSLHCLAGNSSDLSHLSYNAADLSHLSQIAADLSHLSYNAADLSSLSQIAADLSHLSQIAQSKPKTTLNRNRNRKHIEKHLLHEDLIESNTNEMKCYART